MRIELKGIKTIEGLTVFIIIKYKIANKTYNEIIKNLDIVKIYNKNEVIQKKDIDFFTRTELNKILKSGGRIEVEIKKCFDNNEFILYSR